MKPESNKGALLLAIARAAIGESFGECPDIERDADWLQNRAASFVTLKLRNALRGCIGTLEAYRPLVLDVQENARAAAFRDPRFSPLNGHEFTNIDIEVSLLSEPQALDFVDETDALASLRPNIDGVIFHYHQHRSTFLPQVWEQLPDPFEFMAHLKQKAGLPANFWAPEVTLERYTVTKWQERDFDTSPAQMT